MFCEDFFFFLLAKRDVENSELVCSMLRSSIDGDVRIFPRDLYRSYGWPVAPEPAVCTPESPGEIIKNTESWAPPLETVNQ